MAAIELARAGRSVLQFLGRPSPKRAPPEILGNQTLQRLSQFGVDVGDAYEWPCSGTLAEWSSNQAEYSDFDLFSVMSPRAICPVSFKEWLAAIAAQSGVMQVLENGKVAGQSQVSWRENSDEKRAAVKENIIIATGRGSSAAPFVKRLREKKNSRVAFAISWEKKNRHADLVMETEVDGWWYSPPSIGEVEKLVFITDNHVLLGGKAKREKILREKFNRAKLMNSIGELKPDLNLFGMDAHTGHLKTPIIGNCVAVGDLAFSIDPGSGSGLLYAIESGWFAAAEVLKGTLHDGHYANWLERARDNEKSLAQQEYSRAAKRFPNAPFWAEKSNAQSPKEMANLAV